jgi:hypothetical protein
MKLELSNKMLTFALIGLVIVIVLALIINRYRSKSKFEWPVPDADMKQDDTDLTNDLQRYQDTYNLEMIRVNAMPTGDAKTAAIMAAETVLSNDINTRVGQYVSGKCPAVASGSKPAATNDPVVDAANTAAWDAYSSDLAKIQQAYYSIVGDAAVTPTSTPSSDQVLAARKADISGATRKYIATICPKFYYKTADDTAIIDGYKTWTYVATGTAPAIGMLGSDVTKDNVKAWADYAAKTKSTMSSVTVPLGSATAGPVAVLDTTGFAVGDSVQFTYQTVADTGSMTTSAPVMGTITAIGAAPSPSFTITPTTVPSTRYIVPSGTVIAKGMVPAQTKWSKLDVAGGVPNWKKARDYGPGSYPKPGWGTV